MKLLCAQVLKDLLGEGIDVSTNSYTLLRLKLIHIIVVDNTRPGLLFQYEKVSKLTADAKFGKSPSCAIFVLH